MSRYCALCGEAMDQHGVAGAAAGEVERIGRRARTTSRTMPRPITRRECPIVPVERNGRTVWVPRRLAGLEPPDEAVS